MALEPTALLLTVLVVAFVAFVLSAAAGMGGSLILVPALALIIGTKQGIALAALLLAANNVVKVAAYRATLPFRQALSLLVALAAGSALGAVVLIRAPEALIAGTVILVLLVTLVAERRDWNPHAVVAAPTLAFSAGLTSGVSGTSGPLKGVALRQLALDRAHFVGAASLASLVGDVTKVGVFSSTSLLVADSFTIAAAAIPLMLVGTALGRQVNRRVGETGFAVIFWAVMGGYGARLVVLSL